jgi:DegV family protein with EDD domain
MGVRIITDSTAYLPADEIERHNIMVVSLVVSFADGTTMNELDLDDAWFYERLSSTGEVPTSSQPSVHDLLQAFREAAAAGDQAVGVFISAAMSGTYETAIMARNMVAEEFPDAVIELVDSRSNSMQLGMAVLQAARAVEAGEDAAGAARAAGETIAHTRFLFVPHDLEYLKRGGRIGGASALLGALLQVRPILTVENGIVETFGKVRTKRRAMTTIADAFAAEAKRAGLEEVVVHHIDDESEGRELAAMLEETAGTNVRLVAIGPVVGLHVGPGTVGVVYRTREPVEPLGSGRAS